MTIMLTLWFAIMLTFAGTMAYALADLFGAVDAVGRYLTRRHTRALVWRHHETPHSTSRGYAWFGTEPRSGLQAYLVESLPMARVAS